MIKFLQERFRTSEISHTFASSKTKKQKQYEEEYRNGSNDRRLGF